MWEKRYASKKDLLTKKEPELKDLEKSQPIQIAKNEEACLEENTKSVADQLFGKDISMSVSHGLNQHLSRSQEERWNYTGKNVASWD